MGQPGRCRRRPAISILTAENIGEIPPARRPQAREGFPTAAAAAAGAAGHKRLWEAALPPAAPPGPPAQGPLSLFATEIPTQTSLFGEPQSPLLLCGRAMS